MDDHNLGVDQILEKGNAGETYNIGGNNESTNIDIVKTICNLIHQRVSRNKDLLKRYPNCTSANGSHPQTLVTHVTDRLGHDRRYAINAEKISSGLGYSPAESFETGIRKTLEWFLDKEDWWRQIVGGSYSNWIAVNYD